MTQTTKRIPIEALSTFPPPGYAVPNSFSFSNDDSTLTYLFATERDPVQKLYALNITSGDVRVLVEPPGGGVQEDNLSPEEELRRQRERMRAVGITHYHRTQESERLLLPIGGNIYIQDTPNEPLRLLVDTDGAPPALNPTITRDGAWVAYVQDAEIYVIPATGGDPQQITQGARGTGKTHGLAEYIAQEELHRSAGFWWSPDGAKIAFAEVDEAHIPVYRIMHQGKPTTGDGAQEDHRYPFAGQPNAHVRLAVTDRNGGDPIWLNLDFGEEVYIADVFWWDDVTPGAEILNRLQDKLWLVRFDLETGEHTVVYEESSDYWVYRRMNSRVALKAHPSFLFTSERDGFNHIYHWDTNGQVQTLTQGEWVVDQIHGVDEKRGWVYFTGNREHPTTRHFYRVPLAGGEVERLTPEDGTHTIIMDNACNHYVDVYTSLTQPPRVTVREVETSDVIHTIDIPHDSRLDEFRLEPPELVDITTRDGTVLHGALYLPPAEYGEGPFPTVVHVYGGPGPQMVTDSWLMSAKLDLQYLCEQGFLVFRLDNRGSARRGLTFEGALKNHMGTIEVDDQVDGVRWLVDRGLADPERVGVYGWSYGGYMTLMCLAKAPETFKVGVAGAPVTHWDGYDTAYTERYMNTPQDNPQGYEDGSVMAHINALSGKLLLVHGMLDENVHFRHTARLINALNRARKEYDLLIFPDERHMPRHREDRIYMDERIMGYFRDHL